MGRRPIMAISQLRNSNKILIIGLPKCGQHSLLRYLKKEFPDKEIDSVEYAWRGQEGIDLYHEKYEGWQPVIILRDNIDRIWSSYNFFGYVDSMDLQTYLEVEKPDGLGGILPFINPIVQGDYQYWINIWKEYNPIILHLEDLQKLEGFPHENKTETKRSYTSMTQEDRVMIKEAITQ